MSEHERRYEIVLSHSPDVVERVVAERMSEGWRPVGGVAYGHDGGGCVWAQAIVLERRDERPMIEVGHLGEGARDGNRI